MGISATLSFASYTFLTFTQPTIGHNDVIYDRDYSIMFERSSGSGWTCVKHAHEKQRFNISSLVHGRLDPVFSFPPGGGCILHTTQLKACKDWPSLLPRPVPIHINHDKRRFRSFCNLFRGIAFQSIASSNGKWQFDSCLLEEKSEMTIDLL